jgi:predicted ATP-dependent serine protease
MAKDFWVRCNVCGTQYLNWSGSTPCCGSIAYIVEDDIVTNKLSLFASTPNSTFKPAVIEMSNKLS